MAFYVQSAGNLVNKLSDILEEFFGDKAEVKWINGKLHVKVKENAGFVGEDHFLSAEEIAQGVCGGGRIDGLDGKTFCIEVSEIKNV